MPSSIADETNANQLKILVHKRGQCKAKLTRFQSFLATSSLATSEVRIRLTRLGTLLNEFEDIQTQIEILDLDDDSQLEERGSFETLFYSLSSQAEEYIQSHSPQSHTASGIGTTHNNSTPSTSSQVQVRLPSIDLPTFNGNYEDWLSFSETFNALILENESLNDVQRFHYLRSALKGEAAQVIQSLELISSNYSVAWSLLETRYKNKRVIVQKHVKALFDLPSVEREASSSLRALLDGVLRHIRALKALEQPTDSWDAILLYLITSKLNHGLQKEWELSTQPDILPKFNELTDFLQRRCQMLETTHSKTTQKPSGINTRPRPIQNACMLVQNNNCRLCNGNHMIHQCKDLLKMRQSERYQKLRQAGVCFNCLKPGHRVSECSSRGCRICSRKHNTVLHSPDQRSAQQGSSRDSSQEEPNSKNHETKLLSAHTAAINKASSHIILSTAIVDVVSHTGKLVRCRALLDNGSQSCFMTEHICQQLGLPKSKSTCQVVGVNSSPINVNGITTATVKSCVTNYKVNLTFVVVPKITDELPKDHVDVDRFRIPRHIALADPTFGTQSRIDILLGQEIFLEILCIGQQRTRGFPTLQKTRLGWIVGGKIEGSTQELGNHNAACLLTTTERINAQLQNFWTIEEPTSKVHLTSEERRCEEHFKETTIREENGRYSVTMPFLADPNELGSSRELAVSRFTQLERRLARNPDDQKQYCDFMKEYEELNHMEKIEEDKHLDPEYFLPHHAVMKSSSTTTKLRVVFDASASTTSGLSLNDIQMVGPTVQSDIFSIFLRFRTHNIVLTADIEKMYRQVNINPSQRNLLKIIWRESPTQPMQTYRLNTVTYGTASAPYLATRTLMQLAEDEQLDYPNAAAIVKRDFYVDDLLTGADNLEEALLLQRELSALLSKGQFNLRKWSSNSAQVREHLLPEECDQTKQELSTSRDSSVKTLGLWWDPEKDQFHFKHSNRTELKNNRQLTKRIVLSEIARLFDPLGLVGPVIVRAKMQLQELWRLNLSWDESLPMHLHTEWIKLSECLNNLNDVVMARQVTLTDSKTSYDLHGFCDASEKAYGGAVYLRHEDAGGNVKVSLLCAKSRVAPLKTISLPRLELCAALLLSELMQHVASALMVSPERIIYWTDSTVVLAWLQSEPARWTTFVANRVSKIQENTRHGEWRHVITQDNPADVISRGAQAQSLIYSQLWWTGPTWLGNDRSQWPKGSINEGCCNVPEERQRITLVTTTTNKGQETVRDLIKTHSSFVKILRIVAYCLRFKNNTKNNGNRRTGPLSVDNLQEAKFIVLRSIQNEAFPHDLKKLRSEEIVPTRELQRLSPFLDSSGLIRVGGRLEESGLQYENKHPILLPKNHMLTEMIFREEHLRNLHCGPQALLCAVRQQYWPIGGRSLARKITLHCIRCFRAKPKEIHQLMGNLPSSRVTPSRCFLRTGVDYCGPFYTKQTKRRGAKTVKSYVCVFVCLATKAVHLELVSDLSTDTFLGALRRFISRRGICAEIQSDNGSNFVGANRELKELREFFEAEASNIIDGASKEGIRWKFNPPYSPHIGGLWEAAVKSLKHHLRRTVGNASLTFEEFTTILTQVEAVLNSRPLTPLSCDPSDLSVLTPAHFLISGSLTAIPEPSLMQLREGRLSRWQRVQQLLQHFWTRWSREYLNSLQERSKWKSTRPGIQVGTLVLLKDNNLPPLSWPMGRVIQLHPGKDNLVRVVTVRTSTGVVSRAINKLCPLPIETKNFP